METKKILIVDDDIDIITVVKAILSKEGYNVISASDKIEGFKLAYKEKPDMAILDVMMTTQYEGFELAKEFSENPEFAKYAGIDDDFHRCTDHHQICSTGNGPRIPPGPELPRT
jgi:CheY-like chemotaxis protein